jgi:transposase InsO family protein
VRGVWSRHELLTKHERLLRLEESTRKKKVQLSEEQIRLLERFSPEFRERHIETHSTGDLVVVNTFFVGMLKRVGKVHLQTVLDCFSRFAWARFYTSNVPVTAVHVLNEDVLPFFESHGARVQTILSDNGREFCGRSDQHPYEIFLQLEEIEHRTTKVRRPQSNGFLERFHRTLLDEHLRPSGRTKWYESLEEIDAGGSERIPRALQRPALVLYNARRPHRGRGMRGRTPEQFFLAGLPHPSTPPPLPERRSPRPLDLHPGGGDRQANTITVHTDSHH